MAETEAGAEDATEKQMADERRHLHPPNKKKYEEHLKTLATAISTKENDLKIVSVSEDDSCQVEIRNIRAEKDSTVAQRKKIDADLRCHNQEIAKQMALLTKLQSNLQYKNEDRISDAMRRLNYQLTSHNFTLSEEKKIVAEIDSLKRSKKVLEQYLILKKEIDGSREQQKKLREERDRLHKTVTQLKTKEDKLRKQKGKIEILRKEIDELYEQKRAHMAQFKTQEREYQMRCDEARKKGQEKQTQQQVLRREVDKTTPEPFKDEQQLCSTLTLYLQRFLNSNDTNTTTNTTVNTGDASSPNSSSILESNNCQAKDLEAAGLYVLKKKDEDFIAGVSRSRNKRSRRDKRKQSTNKPIVHSPEIFAQFDCLDLTAPPTLTEVASTIEMLELKMKFYTCKQLAAGGNTGDITSNSDHDGSAESAICESIPSTPDVQLDNTPPTFPTDVSIVDDETDVRRFSYDSGTCEFDGMNAASHLQNLQLDDTTDMSTSTGDVVLKGSHNCDGDANARCRLQDKNDLEPAPLIDGVVANVYALSEPC